MENETEKPGLAPGPSCAVSPSGPGASPAWCGLAVASVVLGALSYVCMGPLVAIPTVILGHLGRSRVKRSGGALRGRGLALAGLLLGYANILIVAAAMSWYAYLFAAAVRSKGGMLDGGGCQGNLKQIGLALKMYANESKGQFYPPLAKEPGRLMFAPAAVYPEYLSDPRTLVCPTDTDMKSFRKETKAEILINDESYFYLGYTVHSDAEMLAFAAVYRERMAAGLGMEVDLTVPAGGGANGGTVLYRLQEGVEKAYAAEAGSPADLAGIANTIPLLIEPPDNHKPTGSNILFLDGHVEFRRYPGEWPMTEATMSALESLDRMR